MSGGERGRERIPSRLHAKSSARCEVQSHDPKISSLSRNQESDAQLTEPPRNESCNINSWALGLVNVWWMGRESLQCRVRRMERDPGRAHSGTPSQHSQKQGLWEKVPWLLAEKRAVIRNMPESRLCCVGSIPA